jgi:hypothetical protein
LSVAAVQTSLLPDRTDSTLFLPSTRPRRISPSARGAVPPDHTPGALCTTRHGDFRGYKHPEQIPYCRRNVSTGRKARIRALYGVPSREAHEYEIDHRIPLGLGGSNDDANLWPLPVPDARRKSALEQQLFDAMAAGRMTQAEAVETILTWE